MSERFRIATSHSAIELTVVLTRGFGFVRLALTVTRTFVTQSRWAGGSCVGGPDVVSAPGAVGSYVAMRISRVIRSITVRVMVWLCEYVLWVACDFCCAWKNE